MGLNSPSEPGAYVGKLTEHARKLQREAKNAIAQGDYARASALIGDAELLAEDVHGLVDDIEDRQTDSLLELAANDAAGSARARRRRIRFRGPVRRVGMALGTGLVMSLALVEC